jgi:hypothetical protein
MNTDNITKGTVKTNLEVYEFSKGWNVIEVGSDDAEKWPIDSKWICQVNCVHPEEIEENKANAELICEAFNVAQETGLSPIQMKERIKELEDLLLKVRNYYLFGNDFETGEPKASIKELMEFWEKANEALNK